MESFQARMELQPHLPPVLVRVPVTKNSESWRTLPTDALVRHLVTTSIPGHRRLLRNGKDPWHPTTQRALHGIHQWLPGHPLKTL